MNRIGILLSLSLFLLAGCGDSAVSPQTTVGLISPAWTPPDPALLATQLRRDVDGSLQANNIPGAIVGVWTPAGSWTSAIGFADVEAQTPMSLQDRSAWRSVTKSFTVTVVMQLVAEGRADLDAPVSTYLDGVPNGDAITLRQLANMTSGLFNYTKDEAFIELFSQDLTQTFTTPEILAFAFAHPVNFPAGTQYEYSNTNTLVLGEVAEAITGQPIDELIGTRLLAPLGMSSTVYVMGVELPMPAALGYYFEDETGEYVNILSSNSALGAAGALAGTLDDLHVWGQALVGGTLLPADLQAQRFIGQPPTNGPEYDEYGLGMGQIQGWWGHSGVGIGYQACVFTDPASGSSIVVLLNGVNANQDVPVEIARKFLATIGWPR